MMIANVVGKTAAPPIPITARNPINICGVEANAQAAEDKPNTIKPTTRMRLRPYRSPSTPQVNSRAANTRM